MLNARVGFHDPGAQLDEKEKKKTLAFRGKAKLRMMFTRLLFSDLEFEEAAEPGTETRPFLEK